MEEQQITDILNFVNSALQNKSDAEHHSIQSTLDLAKGTAEIIKNNKHLVPYHLNLIDELHINENGHSRILYKLLEYRNPDGDYIFLKSLLKYISKNCEAFEKICVTNPEITQELCRIDLWVRDKDYAIIFENKVYNATDQEAQIARYIECTQGNGYPLDKIFVIYMPQKDDKNPVDDSWGKYKEDFASRYVKFSFRNGVLSWLKSDVLPSIPDKDKLLKSAIEQYVDYLEGLFKQRESDKQLYIMIENYIKEKLGLNDDPFMNKKKLDRKIEELNEVRQYLVKMKDDYKTQIFEQWNEKLKQDFPRYEWILTKDSYGLYIENKQIIIGDKNILLSLYYEKDSINIEVKPSHKDSELDEMVAQKFSPILSEIEMNEDSNKYGKKQVDWNSAYYVFTKMIRKIEDIR
jgi:hypothetical protein